MKHELYNNTQREKPPSETTFGKRATNKIIITAELKYLTTM